VALTRAAAQLELWQRKADTQEQLKNKAISEAKHACMLASQAMGRADKARAPPRGYGEADQGLPSEWAVQSRTADSDEAAQSAARRQQQQQLKGILRAQVRHLCCGWSSMCVAALDLALLCQAASESHCAQALEPAAARSWDGGASESAALADAESAGRERRGRLESLRGEWAEWDRLSEGLLAALVEGR
jgi:hypothetical protein